MKAVARAGLAAHGVIWILLGVLAAVMAFGGRKEETDQRGALEELAEHTGGWWLLLVITIGLFAYAAWRLVDALLGGDTKDRITSVIRAVIYGGLAISGVEVLAKGGTSSQKQKEQGWSARVMQHDGGRWLIGIIGLVVIGVGAYLAYRGIRCKFEKKLDPHPRAVTVLGAVGSTARGIVVGLAGVLTLVAAINFNPQKASGVDGAFRTVRDAPAGSALLVVVAIGLIMFGIFGCCEAKYRRV